MSSRNGACQYVKDEQLDGAMNGVIREPYGPVDLGRRCHGVAFALYVDILKEAERNSETFGTVVIDVVDDEVIRDICSF